MVDAVKNLGQVFTPEIITEFMCSLISKSDYNRILEPSAGEGVFLKTLENLDFDSDKIDAVELDSKLINQSSIPIDYANFITKKFNSKYDIIIGNPPYVRWKNILEEEKKAFKEDSYWDGKINGQSDLLYAFIYKCIDLLNDNGELIFITPSFWIQTKHSQKLREYMIKNGSFDMIINFNEMKLFKNVSSNIIIFKFTKKVSKNPIKIINFKLKSRIDQSHISQIEEALTILNDDDYLINEDIEAFNTKQFNNPAPFKPLPSHIDELLSKLETNSALKAPIVKVSRNKSQIDVPISKLFEKRDLEYYSENLNFKKVKFNGKNYYIIPDETTLFGEKKSYKRYCRLEDIVDIGNGMVSGLDEAFKIPGENADFTKVITVAKAADLDQYSNASLNKYIFVNDINDEDTLKNEYENEYNKLLPYKEQLEERYDYNRYIPWWHWVFLRNKEQMESSDKKIFVPCKERIDLRNYIRFSYIEGDVYSTQDVSILTKKSWVKEDLKYILALLNSDLILKWIKYKNLNRGGVAEFSARPLSNIPIRFIDWDNPREVEIHENIVHLIDKILNGTSDVKKIKKELEKYVEELLLDN